jgi:glycosyltransferase involved in cell wall biosynthesis
VRPRRVVLVYDGKGFAGAEVHFLLVLKYLDRSRYDPVVVVAGRLWPELAPEFVEALRATGATVRVTPEVEGTGGRLRRFLHTLHMLRSIDSDLAYVGTSTAIGLRRDLLALRLAGMRLVRLLHLPASRMSAFQNGPWSPRGVRMLDRLVALNLTVSMADRDELVRYFELPARKIEVCYHGLELDRLHPQRTPSEARLALGLDPTAPAVGLVGRFSEQKGHRYLVEAAPAILELVRNVQFVLIGSGELQHEIEVMVQDKGLKPKFVFAGFQRDVRPWIEALDVAVMPSKFESAGLVLLECLALERPLVASDLPALREHAGVNTCRLVPVGDPAALSRAVVDALQRPDESRQLAQRGAERVRERFDIRRHVAQLMDAFDRVLGDAQLMASGGEKM